MKYTDAQIQKLRKAVGKQVVAQRHKKDPPWTQFDLAMASGCRPEAISRVERGAVDFGISYLFRIAAALEIEADELLPASLHGSGT